MHKLPLISHCCAWMLSALLFLAVSASAQELEKNIVTGGPSGTYIQIGRDIAGIMEDCGHTLNVRQSAGSIENFEAVQGKSFTQFGIVQNDLLQFLRLTSEENTDFARSIDNMRIAFPLYDEEVHLLATKEIASLSDLVGKRVAIGQPSSGTFVTASVFLNLIGIQGSLRALPIGPEEAIIKLRTGQIDAMFYVAGAPAPFFRKQLIDSDRFHLVPTDATALNAIYAPAEIPAGTYAFQSAAVPVSAVKAVLMTYEYDPNRNDYHEASCKAVSDVAHSILNRFSDLRVNGHPKWRQVDFTAIPTGWDVASCVNIGVAAGYDFSCEGRTEPVKEESDANAAFRSQICAVVDC